MLSNIDHSKSVLPKRYCSPITFLKNISIGKITVLPAVHLKKYYEIHINLLQ